MYLVSGWCHSNFGAGLQALKTDMTNITSCRNVFSIEHTASAVFSLFFDSLCRLGKGKILYGLVKLSTHKIIFFSKSQPQVYS